MATPHDALFKAVFASPDDAAGLIRPLLPARVAAAIAWPTLTLAPGSFVDEALRQRHADLLFAADIGGRPGFLYFLAEHKVRGERFTPLQLLGCTVRIWTQWRGENPGAQFLPRIIPLVLHHGRRRWRAPVSLRALFDRDGLDPATLADLDGLGADLTFRVDDLASRPEAEIRTRPMSALAQLALACMRSLRNADPTASLATVGRWLDAVGSVLGSPGGSERIVLVWSYVLQVTDVPTAQLAELVGRVGPDAEASLMSTAHKLRSEGRIEGRSEGRVEGRSEALLRLLTRRFGPPPAALVDRVRSAGIADLDRWTDAILAAPTLEAVFAD